MLVDNEAKTSWPALIAIFVLALAVGGGIYYWQSQQKTEEPVVITPTVTPTASPTASPTTTETEDETASWKTYTNSDHNFSLKYPTGWSTKNLAGGVRLSSGDEYFDVIAFNNTKALNTNEWLNKEIDSGNIASGSIDNKSTKKIGSYSVIIFQYNEIKGTSHWYIFGDDSKIFEVYTSDDPSQETKNIIEKVIATVKF